MGIINRFITVVKSNINDLINRAEDPTKMLDQIIMDMSKQLEKAKQEVAVSIADEKDLYKKYLQAKKDSEVWENRASIAVSQNNDELAIEALKKQDYYKQTYETYENQWKIQAEAVSKLKISLSELNQKLEEASRKKNLLVARQKRAEAQNKIAKTMQSLSNSSAFDSFSRMEAKIESFESQSEASLILEEELSGKDLEKDFKKLESNQSIQDKLQSLKEKLNKESN